MSRYYSDPSRENDKWALPDIEVFELEECEWWYDESGERCDYDAARAEEGEINPYSPGWYYWYCLPGCMPDSDVHGPFDTEEEAVAAAQEDAS